MRLILRDYVLVGVVATVVLFTNLGGPRLWDRDEPRNAGCAKEMLARHDWVTPVFNAELRAHKPVLLYWLMMTAYSVFGVNEFSARFWSAALAVGTALCTYAVGRRLFHAKVGVWAAVIVSTTLMFDVAGRAATPDSALLFFATLAITVFVVTQFRDDGKHSLSTGTESAHPNGHQPSIDAKQYSPVAWWPAVGVYAAMGFAVLAKGPVGMVLPTAVLGMFLLIQRVPAAGPAPTWLPSWVHRLIRPLRVFEPLHFLRTCWAMRPLTAIAVVTIIALPWYVWVGLRTDGEFLRGFFLEHHFGRATQAMEGHDGSLFFYPVAMLVGFFPWSVFAVPVIIEVVRRIRRQDRWSRGYVFASCWVGVYVGAFSLAQTKLPSYVTPCYPGLALLAGCFLHHWAVDTSVVSQLWKRLALACYGLVGVVLMVALPIVIHEALPGEEWLAAFGLIPLAGSLVSWFWLQRGRNSLATVSFAGSAFAFVLVLFAVGADRVDRHQRNDVLLQAINARGDHVAVASYGCLEPTWVFYGGRPINELTTHSGTWVERQGAWRPKLQTTVANFLQGSSNACIITSDEHLPRLRSQLPPGYDVIAESPYFLRRHSLVVIGASDSHAQTAHLSATGANAR